MPARLKSEAHQPAAEGSVPEEVQGDHVSEEVEAVAVAEAGSHNGPPPPLPDVLQAGHEIPCHEAWV